MAFALFGLGLDGPALFFGHDPAKLILGDFLQSDICNTQANGVQDQRTTAATGAGVKLTHPPRDEINQNVGIPNLRQSLLTKFAIQINLS